VTTDEDQVFRGVWRDCLHRVNVVNGGDYAFIGCVCVSVCVCVVESTSSPTTFTTESPTTATTPTESTASTVTTVPTTATTGSIIIVLAHLRKLQSRYSQYDNNCVYSSDYSYNYHRFSVSGKIAHKDRAMEPVLPAQPCKHQCWWRKLSSRT